MIWSKRNNRRGFTLVELLVVVGLIGILASISVVLYSKHLYKARVARACFEIRMIATEIDQFRVDFRDCPETLNDINIGGQLDPWGNPYEYLSFATTHGHGKMRKDHFNVPINTHYDLYSKGRDGRSTSPLTASISRDDVIRADDGAFVGLACEY